MKLTLKQERFAVKYLELENASAAYREVYSCQNWKESSVWENASRLMKNSKVSARVSELKEIYLEAHSITPEKLFHGVWKLARDAEQEGVRLRAYEILGKWSGLEIKASSTTIESAVTFTLPFTFTSSAAYSSSNKSEGIN